MPVAADDFADRVHGNVRIVLMDLFERAAGLEIRDDGLGKDAGPLDDGLTVHFAGYALNLFAIRPVRVHLNLKPQLHLNSDLPDAQ
jgi:hypothetical protein